MTTSTTRTLLGPPSGMPADLYLGDLPSKEARMGKLGGKPYLIIGFPEIIKGKGSEDEHLGTFFWGTNRAILAQPPTQSAIDIGRDTDISLGRSSIDVCIVFDQPFATRISPKSEQLSTATSCFLPENMNSAVFVGESKFTPTDSSELLVYDHIHALGLTEDPITRRGTGNVPPVTRRTLDSLEALPENWDGEGAAKISRETIRKATALLNEAFSACQGGVQSPSIAPGFGGMIVAEWLGSNGKELILDIPPGDDPPGFLLVEPDPNGDEVEIDSEICTAWSISDVMSRFLGV